MNKPYITKKIFLMEIISLIISAITLILSIILASGIEGEIATHYNLQGEATAYGSAWNLAAMPAVALGVIVFIILLLNLVPANYWNMPFHVTKKNAMKLYSDCAEMMSRFLLELAVFTLILTLSWKNAKLTNYTTWALIAIIAITVVAGILQMKRDAN